MPRFLFIVLSFYSGIAFLATAGKQEIRLDTAYYCKGKLTHAKDSADHYFVIEKSRENNDNLIYATCYNLQNEVLYEGSFDTRGDRWLKNGLFKRYRKNTLWVEELFRNGKREGNLTVYYPDGSVKRTDKFKNGKIQKGGVCYNEEGIKIRYTAFERMPQFPGGQDELIKFLSVNLQYPTDLNIQNVDGKVVMKFTVHKDGSIGDIAPIESTHDYFTVEAERVIRLMPKWKPGLQYGEPVSVWFRLPIKFTKK